MIAPGAHKWAGLGDCSVPGETTLGVQKELGGESIDSAIYI